MNNLATSVRIEGFEKIFSSDKLSQGSKLQSITTWLCLEQFSDSQAKCAALITESSNSESSQAGASLESLAKGTKNSMGLSTIALNCTEGGLFIFFMKFSSLHFL
ncbi:hypothetical protein ES319_D08G175500v1 [Gossypium barbadense]|uniref:Uncharacterized protein n=1 Tax=Gossypium barbadense TaxID=3634 RepID=A0A5J5QEV1_GOSBA|nr:hypothetical protein ES319_D08G175500v1 [Gossypium barbadense]